VSFTACALALAFATGVNGEMPIAEPPIGYYAPVPTFHDRMKRGIGIVSSYVVGSSYAEAVILELPLPRGGAASEYHFVISDDFLIEGRSLYCEEAPTADHPVASVLCPDWPSDIVLDETPVIFTYWRARAGDEEIAVLRRIDPVPGGLAGMKKR
jgi:hypothetical protein